MHRVSTGIELYQQGDITYNSSKEAITNYSSFTPNFTPNSILKSAKPIRLKITMGHKCNYECDYCLQDPLGEKKTFDTKDLGFLNTLDLSETSTIELWGGEPLIYWVYMKEIIDRVDRPGLSWVIVTNGSLLKEKHLKYFDSKEGDFKITISHDGPMHTTLRGKDIFPEKTNLVKELASIVSEVRFNTVLSNNNFDMFAIEDHLSDFGFFQNYELIAAYDSKSYEHTIKGSNLPLYDKLLRKYLVDSGYNNSLKHDLTSRLETIMDPVKVSTWSKCGIDIEEMLSIDIEGNIKPCQNVGKAFIKGSTDAVHLASLEGIDFTTKRKCESCEVRTSCKGGCPLVKADLNLFAVNCGINYIHYKAIQDIAYQMLFKEI